jgi:hypothetical protein
MGSSPDTPKEDPSAKALRKRQVAQLMDLDEDANIRVKRLSSAAQGLRIARGSADSRLPRGDSTNSPAPDNYGLTQSNARGYARKTGGLSAKRNRGTSSVRKPRGP